LLKEQVGCSYDTRHSIQALKVVGELLVKNIDQIIVAFKQE
jgi:hypothetical protein